MDARRLDAAHHLDGAREFALDRADARHLLHERGQAERAELVVELVADAAGMRQALFGQRHAGRGGRPTGTVTVVPSALTSKLISRICVAAAGTPGLRRDRHREPRRTGQCGDPVSKSHGSPPLWHRCHSHNPTVLPFRAAVAAYFCRFAVCAIGTTT